MAPGLLDRLTSWMEPSEDETYEVREYVLSRREPDPQNRLRVFEEPIGPEEVELDDLEAGVYLLQEIKPTGMAGAVVWEEALGDTDLVP